MWETFSKLTTKALPLLFTLNIFDTLLYCFSVFASFFFLLTVNMQMADRILYYVNVNLSMHFRVSCRICLTKVNKSFQSLSIFCLKELHLIYWIGFELNILISSTKFLKVIGGSLYDLEKIWKIHPPRCPKNTFPAVVRIEIFVFNIKRTKQS